MDETSQPEVVPSLLLDQHRLPTLLDIRTVFDPGSAMTVTLREAIGEEASANAVAWVSLPEPGGGLVIEQVLGQRTSELSGLGISIGRGVTGRVFQHAKVHWVDQYAASTSITHDFDQIIEAERVQRLVAAPLQVDERMLGVLSVGRRDSGSFGDDALLRIEQLARRASLALEIARRSRDRSTAAALAERRRISEELHDGVGALLFTLSSRAERLARQEESGALSGELDQLRGELVQVSAMVRSLVSRWHESASDDLAAEVQGMVEDFERRSGVQSTAVLLGTVPPVDSARMEAVSRFLGVALANVERHAHARSVTVTLAGLPGQLSVAVCNDGPPPIRVVPGVGLVGARQRLERLGGELSTVLDDEAGFTVRARIPL